MPTVIVPVHTTHTRDCVVVEGKKYCETGEGSAVAVVGLFIGVLAFLAALWALGKSFSKERWDNWDTIRSFGLGGIGLVAGVAVCAGFVYAAISILS
jgi:hypothetical protein